MNIPVLLNSLKTREVGIEKFDAPLHVSMYHIDTETRLSILMVPLERKTSPKSVSKKAVGAPSVITRVTLTVLGKVVANKVISIFQCNIRLTDSPPEIL